MKNNLKNIQINAMIHHELYHKSFIRTNNKIEIVDRSFGEYYDNCWLHFFLSHTNIIIIKKKKKILL